MENQISISVEELKRELEKSVHLFVESKFNYIQVGVLEKYCDNTLQEYIRNQSPEEVFEDWLNDCNEMEKVAEFFVEKQMSEFDVFQQRYESTEGTMFNCLIECLGIEIFEEFKEWCIEEYSDDIYDYIYEQENYPMWNTCFEFRDSYYNQEENIEKCISVGLGVIEGLDDFNISRP